MSASHEFGTLGAVVTWYQRDPETEPVVCAWYERDDTAGRTAGRVLYVDVATPTCPTFKAAQDLADAAHRVFTSPEYRPVVVPR
jgi:hypothetical protein